MEWIGDLERAIATNLYPLRVPIAIGLAIGFGALVILARRRGWLAAARRHRGRATIIAVTVLAIGVPAAWYLGSPLFIRTSLVEAAPTAAPTAAPSAASTAAPLATRDIPSAPTRTGQFTGADDFHFGSGTANLIEATPGAWILRFEDFSVRNGPDLYVYLSPEPDGYANGALELGALKATDGSFNYEIPSGTDIGGIRSVVIWCKQFAVQFAVAPLH